MQRSSSLPPYADSILSTDSSNHVGRRGLSDRGTAGSGLRVAGIGPVLKHANLGNRGRRVGTHRGIREITAAPDAARTGLRFVSIQAVRPHEQHATAHRDDLAVRLDNDGVLRNPIVVAEVRPGAYVLLDGTHRLAYLQQHGYSDALVQVVRLTGPESVQLSTWAHLASVDEAALLVALARLGCGGATPASDRLGDAPRAADVAWLSFARHPRVVYRLRGHDRLAALSTLLSLYQPERLASDALGSSGARVSEAAFSNFPGRNLLVQFAPFTATDIRALHDAEDQIPSGITRVVINGGRVLGTNTPLKLLQPEATSYQRDAWLASLGARCPRRLTGPTLVYEPGPRRYAEPVVIYDSSVRAEPVSFDAAAA
jgi:hypothetical protein